MSDFAAQMRAVGEGWEQRASAVTRKIGLELFGRVILKTPVDTGRARGAWVASVGRPSSQVPAGLPGKRARKAIRGGKAGTVATRSSGAGSAAIAAMTPIVAGSQLGQRVYLANNVTYIRVLDFGLHTGVARYEARGRSYVVRRVQGSRQAPAGMVGISIAEIERAFARVAI